jgi:hypothetical protein
MRRRNGPWMVVSLIGLLVALLFTASSIVRAGTGEATDPDEPANTGIDIAKVSHDSDSANPASGCAAIGNCMTWTAETYADFTTNDFYLMRWDLDYDNDGEPSESGEACIVVEVGGGGVMTATLKPDCLGDSAGTANVTKTEKKLTFTFLKSEIQATGLSPTATSYGYRVSSTDLAGNNDTAPDTGLITHNLAAAATSAPPSTSASPTPAGSSSPTATLTPTPSSSATSTPSGSASPTPSGSPTQTPCPTATPSASPSASASASASPSATPSASPTPTGSPSTSSSPSPSPTPAGACANVTVTGVASPSKVEPGDKVKIEGDGFTSSSNLTATFQSDPIALGTIVSNGSGAFATTVTVPAAATAGSHHIVVTGANSTGGLRTISYPVTVLANESTNTTGSTTSGSPVSGGGGASLPRTGWGIAGLLFLALVFVLGGASVASQAVISRRERAASESTYVTSFERRL